MNIKKAILLLIFIFACSGCRPKETGGFTIYLLAEDIPSTELAQVDLAQLELQDSPILTSENLLSYNKATHELTLTDAAFDRFQRLFPSPVKVDGIPFVVCVGEGPIYAGALWTPLSSLSYDGVVILQPFNQNENKVRIELGYPGPQAFTGQDPRSDARIIQSLEAEGKLK